MTRVTQISDGERVKGRPDGAEARVGCLYSYEMIVRIHHGLAAGRHLRDSRGLDRRLGQRSRCMQERDGFPSSNA